MRTAHKKNNLASALRCAAKQLGLVSCAECPTRKPVLKDFWPLHVAYFHSGNIQGNRNNFKEKKTAENTTSGSITIPTNGKGNKTLAAGDSISTVDKAPSVRGTR